MLSPKIERFRAIIIYETRDLASPVLTVHARTHKRLRRRQRLPESLMNGRICRNCEEEIEKDSYTVYSCLQIKLIITRTEGGGYQLLKCYNKNKSYIYDVVPRTQV